MKITDNDNGSIFSVFSGLDKFINIVSDMVESEKNEVNISGDMKPDNENKISGRYGFNIKLGPESAGGAPADQAFNNLFVRKDGAPKTVEPVTDVFEEENAATIVAELPGVEKDDIAMNLDGNTITLSAAKSGVSYLKKIALKFSPNPGSVRESFNNSIYSVSVEADA